MTNQDTNTIFEPILKQLDPPHFDLVTYIIEFEEGTLDLEGVLALFSHLIRTGQAWSLQGSYGRAASNLIENGIIAQDGTILKSAEELNDPDNQ